VSWLGISTVALVVSWMGAHLIAPHAKPYPWNDWRIDLAYCLFGIAFGLAVISTTLAIAVRL
jgi:hypothetical protein